MAQTLGTPREQLTILSRTDATDSQGGRTVTWSTLDSVTAELMPLRAGERLQLEAMQAQVDYRFRIRARADVTARLRALWRQSWLGTAAPKTLEINGVWPDPDRPLTHLFLDCGEVAT